MLKRICIVLAISLAFIVAAEPANTVHGILMTPAEVEMVNSTAADSSNSSATTKDNGGNGFVRVLKAPFKAIGRLFGFGRKDNNKLQRMSEKDAKKFESSALTRVVDARIAPDQQTTTRPAADQLTIKASTMSDKEAKLVAAREQLEYGRQLLNNGDFNGAINTLSVAISLNSKLKEAHNLMGVAYESKGLRGLAFKSFELALKGDDDDVESLNNLGYLYLKNGQADNALKYFKRAVKRAPDNQRYWNNLGLAQAQLEKFEDAFKSFSRAAGELEGHLNLAARLERQGYSAAAIKHLEQARTLKPTSTEILARLVALYDFAGRTTEAQEARNSLTTLRALATTPKE